MGLLLLPKAQIQKPISGYNPIAKTIPNTPELNPNPNKTRYTQQPVRLIIPASLSQT
ncbi:hypothetical protein V6Z11_A04G017900 [Gossypium hirsutum]